MAKKPSRSGGRVTPKGTQPSGTNRGGEPTARSRFEQPRQQPLPGRSATGPMGPTRSGRRGNR